MVDGADDEEKMAPFVAKERLLSKWFRARAKLSAIATKRIRDRAERSDLSNEGPSVILLSDLMLTFRKRGIQMDFFRNMR